MADKELSLDSGTMSILAVFHRISRKTLALILKYVWILNHWYKTECFALSATIFPVSVEFASLQPV